MLSTGRSPNIWSIPAAHDSEWTERMRRPSNLGGRLQREKKSFEENYSVQRRGKEKNDGQALRSQTAARLSAGMRDIIILYRGTEGFGARLGSELRQGQRTGVVSRMPRGGPGGG
jgi:hypothetical protein